MSRPGTAGSPPAHSSGRIDVWVLPAGEARAGLARLLGGAEPERAKGGKPYLPGGPHFNLSHSGELALIAVSAEQPVGVDREAPRSLRNREGLARRMCTERELAALAGAADPAVALLRLWVRKEAVAKAEGGGIVTALSGIDVLGPLVRTRDSLWVVHDLSAPAPGYLAALAWSAEG